MSKTSGDIKIFTLKLSKNPKIAPPKRAVEKAKKKRKRPKLKFLREKN